MTRFERDIRGYDGKALMDSFERAVTMANDEVNRLGRVTKATQKWYDAVKTEIMRRMNNEDTSRR